MVCVTPILCFQNIAADIALVNQIVQLNGDFAVRIHFGRPQKKLYACFMRIEQIGCAAASHIVPIGQIRQALN